MSIGIRLEPGGLLRLVLGDVSQGQRDLAVAVRGQVAQVDGGRKIIKPGTARSWNPGGMGGGNEAGDQALLVVGTGVLLQSGALGFGLLPDPGTPKAQVLDSDLGGLGFMREPMVDFFASVSFVDDDDREND